ncbi:MAG: 1-deoxy-D-xylulose-5-phosphate reductoisomerase [Elusimicrobiota bacterium]|jgi:1-deoxy-D-xylulose-5-phosphate reductoisomerase
MTERPANLSRTTRQRLPVERRVVILGSTGSIGVNALGVTELLNDRCRVVGLTAHSNTERLLEQVKRYHPEVVAVWEESAARDIRAKGIRVNGKPLAVLSGLDGLVQVATWPSANFVLSSVVGAIGLRPLLAALRMGRTVALSNKEALVMAGPLVMAEAKRWKATLLPVDSEHSAIFQCLQGSPHGGVKQLLLTASGGPFYRSKKSLARMSVEQALAHPTWKMGRKITIDSATLMNKGLEMLEASILFDLPIDQVNVVIHPQSIVHSLVEFVDGAMLAQLSWPDMCLPIQYAMTYPERLPGRLKPLDLVKVRNLEFLQPDFHRFPCLTIARDAARQGGTWPTVLNAADEVAVYAFLNGQIHFGAIPRIVEKTLAKHQGSSRLSLETVLEADRWARHVAKEFIR